MLKMIKKKTFFLLMIGLFSLVFVQPSMATLVTLQPADGKDAHIAALDPTTNYGAFEYLTANWTGTGSIDDKGLLEFDLTSLAGANIIDATLSFYHVFNSGNGATFDLFRNTAAWDEAAVTWDSAPAYDAVSAASLSISDDNVGVWRDWDITALVQGWTSGTYDNYGMTFSRVDQSNSDIYFASSDNTTPAWAPKLTINYDSGNNVVPEPSTYLLLGSGLAGLAFWRRRQKSRG
ncbi:hypothetical protein MNBD_DELTA01-135 [hydrothermal vent metagenome]|uniref:Uncharacterized protein n=1 Tax=hydrothermal vent metagenome TaxID=652676 RepID=A0A3B0RMM4_9ZZZZ